MKEEERSDSGGALPEASSWFEGGLCLAKDLLPDLRIIRVVLQDFVADVDGGDVPLCLEVIEGEPVSYGGSDLPLVLPCGLVVLSGVLRTCTKAPTSLLPARRGR